MMTESRFVDNPEGQYVSDMLYLFGVEEAGENVLLHLLFVFDIGWTKTGVYLLREEADYCGYPMVSFAEPVLKAEAEELLVRRSEMQDAGVFEFSRGLFCHLLNSFGFAEVARANFAMMMAKHGISAEEEGD